MKQMSFILESRVSGHCYISFDVRQLFFKVVTNSRYIITASTFVIYDIIAKIFSMIGHTYFVDVLASLPRKILLPLQHRDNIQYCLPEGSENKLFSCNSLQKQFASFLDLFAMPISFGKGSKVQQSCVSSYQYIL